MNNLPIRPILISFWSPPAVRPQAILLGKMVPEWLRQGIEPVLVTLEREGKWDIGAPFYELPHFTTNKYLRAVLPVYGAWTHKRYLERLFRSCEEIIKRHEINIVFSFSNPQASNILGAMLKQRLGIKFVSHFSDPWTDNPYKNLSEKQDELRQEKLVVMSSDRIIFVTEELKNLVMKKYSPELLARTAVIPHSFDPADYAAQARETGPDTMVFSHIGAFYKERNPALLLQAFQGLFAKKPDLRRRVKIRFIGGTNKYTGYSEEALQDEINRYGLQEHVESVPPVNFRESLRLMTGADCLVVIDANFAGSPFLPSKVVDYAGSRKPIIGITPEGSPTAQFLLGLGQAHFNYDQVGDLEKYLEKFIEGRLVPSINLDFLKQFEVKNTTQKLITKFREALNG